MDAKVKEWIRSHKDELLKDVKELCAIPSVKGAYEEGKPYGPGPFESLNFTLNLCEKYGFPAQNLENYVGFADFDPSLPPSLDILAHTDVVPAGEGWTVTEPFRVIEKDGRLYGRGTSDDKGPLLAALYAMRAIKECGIPLKKGVRMIVGADEECGSSDIEKYYEKYPEGEMTFSPDAEFPLINIEKGQFRAMLSKDFKEDSALPRLLSLEAGIAVNAVPQKAVLRFEGLEMEKAESAMREIEKECGVKCEISGPSEITVIGSSAHAAKPESGRNAGLSALLLVEKLPLHPSELLAALKKVSKLFPYGVTDGSGLGIRLRDPESGDLSCTLDIFHVDPKHIEFIYDCRTPVTANEENCYARAKASVEAEGLDYEAKSIVPPHKVSADSDFVQKLLRAYEDVTGLKGECLAIGGGTYVHHLKNGVAFGAVLPDVDTRMHGADEFMDVENLLLASEVYAESILLLCR